MTGRKIKWLDWNCPRMKPAGFTRRVNIDVVISGVASRPVTNLIPFVSVSYTITLS